MSFIRTIYLHCNVKIFPRKITMILKSTFNKQLPIKIIYSTAIRTCNLMNHEVASLTAQLHISFLYSPLNKVHYIFLIYFPRYYRGFLECLYAFVTFLLHRDTSISQSFKKSVSRSPCTLFVSTGIASLTLVISVIIWTVVLEWLH